MQFPLTRRTESTALQYDGTLAIEAVLGEIRKAMVAAEISGQTWVLALEAGDGSFKAIITIPALAVAKE
jgi:hypothetical protein